MNIKNKILYMLKGNQALRKFYYFFFYKIKGETAPLPSCINIEVTHKCNLKCVMCNRNINNLDAEDLTFDNFKRIVTQFPRLKSIGVMGLGEPLCNKEFYKMLEYTKKKNIDIVFTTNGTLITEANIKKLTKNVSNIWFSIDSMDPEKYRKIRVGANLESVIKNMKLLHAMRPDIKITIQTLLMKVGISNLTDFIYLAKEVDGNVFFIHPILNDPTIYDQHIHEHPELYKHVVAADRLAKKLGVNLFSKPAGPEMTYTYNFCTNPWRLPHIALNGNLFGCCYMYRMPDPKGSIIERYCGQDMEVRLGNYIMGNVFKTPVKEFWNSKKYRLLRHTVKQSFRYQKLTPEKLNALRKNIDNNNPFYYCSACLYRCTAAC